jgi:hypothetical protein
LEVPLIAAITSIFPAPSGSGAEAGGEMKMVTGNEGASLFPGSMVEICSKVP